MQSVRVKLGNRSYDIRIGAGVAGTIGPWVKESGCGDAAFVVTNRAVERVAGAVVCRSLAGNGCAVKIHSVPDSETSKSLRQARTCLADLARFDYRRKTFIVALGGGVVGDLAGFVASVYKRGIPYVQVPTTLLAQVDSAIGGKTAIDLPEGKNLVGSFYQPRIVLSDTSFVSTLKSRQVRSGLAEIIKYGAILDAAFFGWLEKNIESLLTMESASLEHAVKVCSAVKAAVVSADERDDKGVRMLLNFGHTVGHAIEAAGRYRLYNHGEAIALGMVCAAQISARMKMADELTVRRLESLLGRAGLPTQARGVSANAVLKAQYRDKKFIGESNRFVMLRSIGRGEVRDHIPESVVKQSVSALIA